VAKKPITVSSCPGVSIALDDTRRSVGPWQDRIRDPSLTVLLVLELCTIFLAAPLAAKGLPIARAVGDTLVLAALVIVVMLSHRWGAVILILLGLAAIAASFLPNGAWAPVSAIVLRRGGDILAFSTLTWAVAHAGLRSRAYYISSPARRGRTLSDRRDDLRLSLWPDLGAEPWRLRQCCCPVGGAEEVGTMLYFSLTTLTTTGYGDIVAVDPFARSLANLESVLGQFFLAITVTRLVTLELADRRRRE
jgi:Ion channel